MLIEGKPRSVVLQQSLYQNLQRYKNPPNSFKESEEFSAIKPCNPEWIIFSITFTSLATVATISYFN